MSNEFEKLMLKFLNRNYPVSRVKVDSRFKRAIVLESGEYVLSNIAHQGRLRFELMNILIKVFSCDEKTSKAVLDNFL